MWRSGRDSNPRWAFDPYSLSRRAPSTTRPPLRMLWRLRALAGLETLRKMWCGVEAMGAGQTAGSPGAAGECGGCWPDCAVFVRRVAAGAAVQRSIAFCRRRCTEEPRPIASRYLATVRRARSKPVARSRSTSVSSDRIALGSSASISARIVALDRLGRDRASPPSADWTPDGEEILQLEHAALAVRDTCSR